MLSSRVLVLVLLFCWPGVSATAQQLLQLTFAPGHSEAFRTHETRTATTISVLEGHKVTMQRSSGRDYRLQASHYGWSWTQVQQVPRDATYIAVTPTLQGAEVQLEVDYFSAEGDETVSYTGAVKGGVGEWIPLLQSSIGTQPDTGKSYSSKSYTSKPSSEELSVKVELPE